MVMWKWLFVIWAWHNRSLNWASAVLWSSHVTKTSMHKESTESHNISSVCQKWIHRCISRGWTTYLYSSVPDVVSFCFCFIVLKQGACWLLLGKAKMGEIVFPLARRKQFLLKMLRLAKLMGRSMIGFCGAEWWREIFSQSVVKEVT